MKLRIQGNSIRLRLNRNEVAVFAGTGRMQDAVHFGGGAVLEYAVEVSREADAAHAFFEGNAIRITLPMDDAQDWARSDRVAISGRDQQLSILVEKDFQCLHQPEPEPDPHAYPNPDAPHH